ncbi:MAG: N-acetylmuramoyl-L-alanine amidase [Magnetovibrio sp.]|nr:N-acetylmuramoyl-L-alanine amidase [Magnetovibrio sp.]|tara:strand:- start:53 stop:739 length:687 start_codon:yes stop_codon:yes gene_type:complete
MSAASIIERPSLNYDTRKLGTAVDMLVVHYTGMLSATEALERLCSNKAQVSAHYCIDEDGSIYQLVAENMQAWHAGVSYWRGSTDINNRSIGIEMVNPGHEFGYRPFKSRQMDAFRELTLDILARHRIPARNVVGHSDVAPVRKSDPGEYFDWHAMAKVNIGLWPKEANHLELAPINIKKILFEIGYDVKDLTAALRAFQRHYRPARVNGRIDPETARRIIGLRELID